MRLAALAVCALALAAPSTPAQSLRPIEDFTSMPLYDGLAISPGGKYLALAQRQQGKQVLTIIEFPSMKPLRNISFGQTIDIAALTWVDDRIVLVEPARQIAWQADAKLRTGEIIRADAETGRGELIFGWVLNQTMTNSIAGKKHSLTALGQVLSGRSDEKYHVLIQAWGHNDDPNGGIYKMDIRAGQLDRVAASPVPGGNFVLGPDYRIVAVSGTTTEDEFATYYLPQRVGQSKPGETGWVRQVTGSREKGSLAPVGWTGTGEELYALDNRDAPTLGIFNWDAKANTQKLLYRHPFSDMGAAGYDYQGRPWVFRGVDHYPVYWYPDPQHPLARLHALLARELPQHDISITSFTDDLSVAVAYIRSGRRPPTYLVFDLRSNKPLQWLPAYPNLKPESLLPVQGVSFKARDGLEIRGYLTTPAGADGKPRTKNPMIVVVHGGPHGVADGPGYDFERQIFASRGYAVLQVNYRGSGGRGREFQSAGYGEWGAKMQDDVTDGVRWAIQQGVADASRICIYGGSYGAYSALVGVYREPDLFKCAIGMSGVYDLELMYEAGDVRMRRNGVSYLKDVIGEDRAQLRARSPVFHAAEIKAKVMLLHGQDDVRAPPEHAQRMRKALTEAGNPPEWIFETGEGHGFFEESNRAQAYGKMLEFLNRNIGMGAP